MPETEDTWRTAREMVGGGRLSVIMPAYRLCDSVFENLSKTASLFSSHGLECELVPVDDGSGDGTADEIARFAAAKPPPGVSVRPVLLENNGGKGTALKAGFAASTGEYVLLLDGDLDIHPGQTPLFFAEMAASGADIVVGSKRHPRSVVQYPWHRRLASAVYFAFVKLLVGLPVTDTQTGMKLFRRKVLGEALERMLVKSYAFDLELLAIAFQRGAKLAEAPVAVRFGMKFGALRPSTVKSMSLDSLAVFYRLNILKYYMKAECPAAVDPGLVVSVVVACPGDSAMLRQCVASIAAQTWKNVETIVMPDEPVDLGGGPSVRVVPTGKVRPAEKRNAGIKAACGEIVAFIDDDAYADPRWLEIAVRYFSNSDVGAVGGPGVTPPGDPPLCAAGGRVYSNPLVSGSYRYRYVSGGVRRDVDDYPSCNLLVRKSVLEKIGGYRTDFWPGEDTLLCKDIVDSGLRIVYDPWAVVFHHRRALFAPHLRQLGRYAFHRGYFVKRYPSNSKHPAYFVPSALVAYLALLPLLALPGVPCAARIAFTAPAALYLLAVAATSFSLNPFSWMLVAAGVAATHATYGVRFLQGLFAKAAPCEFIGGDRAR